jgi:hypothetical protein
VPLAPGSGDGEGKGIHIAVDGDEASLWIEKKGALPLSEMGGEIIDENQTTMRSTTLLFSQLLD